MGTKFSRRKPKKFVTNPNVRCCDIRCISRIQNLQELVTIGSTWTFKDEHRSAIHSTLSNKNLPVDIAQIICSYLDYTVSEYAMIHHRAVNDYCEGSTICNDFYEELMVCLIGKNGAGKSGLVQRFVMDCFVEDYYAGFEDSYRKQWEVKGVGTVLFDILVTVEQEFSSLNEQWFRQCHVVAFCFAIHDTEWMDGVIYDLENMDRFCAGGSIHHRSKGVVLIGCQMDRLFDMKSNKDDERVMMEENRKRAIEFSQQRNIPYIETSAKANVNGIEMFEQIVYEYWLESHSNCIKWNSM